MWNLIIFPCERVAPEIHLPAGDTVDHPRPWRLSTAASAFGGDGTYELCIRLRPLVEVQVCGSWWDACVSDAGCDADGTHSALFGRRKKKRPRMVFCVSDNILFVLRRERDDEDEDESESSWYDLQ